MSSPVVIASANGLAATALAFEQIARGVDPLDAVVAGVGLVEDDPEDLTVGYGGLPNEQGVVELDAAVMHGPTHRAGGVAALRNVRHAAQVARLVLEQTDHTLLVGDGALQFARAQGFVEENLLTETSRKIWLYWKQTLSSRHDWIAPPPEKLDPAVRNFFHGQDDHDPSRPPPSAFPRSEADVSSPRPNTGRARPTGTIHCSGMSRAGDISCVTTTSGLAFKLPGRVGDSAVIGAGLYVDNAHGSCGSTGRGEANLRACSSYAVVDLLRRGATPADAGLEVMHRIVTHTHEAHLLRPDGRPDFGLKLYILSRTGRHAGVSLWGPAKYAVTDGDGTRLADCVSLFTRD